MEAFKAALQHLLDSINLNESEEHAKNHLRDFLKSTFYEKYGVNTKGKTDLVIHTGATTKSNAGVLLEVKRPTNKADMPTPENLNYKATHELLLYYLRERVEHQNHDLRHLVVTSVHEWFVFDALEFDRLFYRNTQLRKDFTDWAAGRKASTSTDFFYKHIATPYIASLSESISFTHFNLLSYEKPLRNKDLKDDVKLVALYKMLSPAHLLKEPFANDANSLDKGFYQELLHIIGLEEVKDGGRKLIRRKEKPNHGSLLEAAYQKLRSEDLVSGLDNTYSFGNTREEQLFNVSLELCITWVNRILFLKLLEAQLISYHQGDKRFAFMSAQNLQEFDDLNELFFDVLAERPQNRAANVRQKYGHIPYLNSSLFETTELEKRTLRISNLKDRSLLPLHPQTVLRDAQGKSLAKSKTPELHTLEYLLRFLGSYDFGAEGKEEIQEENKTLITASVLGLIFEKINGYRDGSFYTPGFITMYMSREAIRRAVVQRFSEKYNWDIDTSTSGSGFESLHLRIHQNYTLDKLQEYNELLNSLRICDPAVGSGHYLVSALNELIVIKAELRLLLNRQGKPLHYGSIEVQNDELIVTDYAGELFSYTVHLHPDGHRSINPQVQELQEALFHEKQTIIENCLFGVDINPNSVKICRLRLWIELLKNAYYLEHDVQHAGVSRISSQGDADVTSPVCYANTSGLRNGFEPDKRPDKYTQLQTLPNIDINIKQGNSLLSRYPLSADLHEAFGKKGHSLQAYREAVRKYKHTNSKADKKQLVTFLEEIKQGFKTTLANNDPLRRDMAKLRGQIAVMQDPDLFGAKKIDKKELQRKQKQLQKLEDEREQIETNKVYEGAFEWRFEFPEVLDEEGKYKGFDVVIGNPPYIRADASEELLNFRKFLSENNMYKTLAGKWDMYVAFVELSITILRTDGNAGLIIPDAYCHANYAQKSLKWLQDSQYLKQIDYFPGIEVFEGVGVSNVIVFLQKNCEFRFLQRLHKEVNLNIQDTLWNRYPENFRIDFTESILASFLREITSINILSQICYVSKGVVGNSDEKHYKGLFKVGDLLSDYKDESHPFLYFEGKDIQKWVLNKRRWIEYGTNRSPSKWSRKSFPEFFIDEKIVAVRSPGKSPRLLLDCEGGYFNESAIGFKRWADLIGIENNSLKQAYNDDKQRKKFELISKKFSYKYLLALLNSSLFKYELNTKRRSNIHIYPDDYKSLPIATPDEETKASITALVEQILSIKQADAAADTSGLEAEIDVLVYRLYKLTYEEVLLVDPTFALPKEAYEQQPSAALAASGGPTASA